MIVDIEPFSVSFSCTKLDVVLPSFELGATDCTVYADLTLDSGAVVKREIVHIPPDVYANWGQDDKFIVDYVAKKLNIMVLQSNLHQNEHPVN